MKKFPMASFMDDLTAYLCALHIKQVKQATFFKAPNCVVQVTEVGKYHKRKPSLDFRVTVGKPNYAARKRAKQYVKAGEPFPVKRLHTKGQPGTIKAA